MASKKKQIRILTEQVEFLQTLVDVMQAHYTGEYEAGLESGRNCALDNIDSAIELKRNAHDEIAVAVLEWAKERL
jgi:hypothetical protein